MERKVRINNSDTQPQGCNKHAINTIKQIQQIIIIVIIIMMMMIDKLIE